MEENKNVLTEEENTEESKKEKLGKSEKSVKKYQSLIIKWIIFLFAIWLLFFVFLGLTHMPSNDMHPRIDHGDLVLFYRLDRKPKAQDIIVLDKVVDGKKATYISRVVAQAGDTVDIKEEQLYINGNAMIEADIYYGTMKYTDSDVEYPVTLKEGEYFVLSDYRKDGVDSRVFGPVNKSEIDGVVITLLRRNGL